MSNGTTTFTPGLEEKKENNSLVRSASVWSLKRCGLCPFAKALKLYLVWNAWFVEMEQAKNEDIYWIAKFNALEREDVLDCMIWIVDWLGTNLHAKKLFYQFSSSYSSMSERGQDKILLPGYFL